MLLRNLKDVRRVLMGQGLSEDHIHALLGRVIFIQFLFHRKDSTGEPALSATTLRRLADQQVLSRRYNDLASILRNRKDTYRLFRWLNQIFNGDLFPNQDSQGSGEWSQELSQVRSDHLRTLADFVDGQTVLDDGQRSLWPQYHFDAIPLDLISSIYEEFMQHADANSRSVHYTPNHLVDFVLDQVLPWGIEGAWNVRVLDPACGSGIFLVKAYQRLIHRWRLAHPGDDPPARLLREILQQNLVGVDRDANAIRVASFSLYLAMCDEVDPRHYWTRVRFPTLRGESLLAVDFFSESTSQIRSDTDTESFDIVVGNAPWGANTVTEAGRAWLEKQSWPLPSADQGPLFLVKAARLTKRTGTIAMLQPAGVLLFNQSGPARELRRRIFTEWSVSRVINLSLIRRRLFSRSVSPACCIVVRPVPSSGAAIIYVCPKPSDEAPDEPDWITIEPHDVNTVSIVEAAEDPIVWIVLALGGPRDLMLIRHLRTRETLDNLEAKGIATSSEGIIPRQKASSTKVTHDAVVGRRLLDNDFPKGTFVNLDVNKLPVNRNPLTQRRTSLAAFQSPQLLIKQGVNKQMGRFRAALVREASEGALATQSFISVHVSPDDLEYLDAAWLAMNSSVALYFLAHTSRAGLYRPEALKRDLMQVPLPDRDRNLLSGVQSYESVDARAYDAYGLNESDRILIEDFLDYRVPEHLANRAENPNASTRGYEGPEHAEQVLREYCDTFLRVLSAGFGADVGATILAEAETTPQISMRAVAIHLDWPFGDRIQVERISSNQLLERLGTMNRRNLKATSVPHGFAYRRVLRVYDVLPLRDHRIPSVVIAKPDRIGHWTPAMAMRDADSVSAEALMQAAATGQRSVAVS
jgi:SAM-dependent methyltransferase